MGSTISTPNPAAAATRIQNPRLQPGATLRVTISPTAPVSSSRLSRFCNGQTTGRPGRISWSLPNAITLPVTVSAPRNTSKPSAAMVPWGAAAPSCRYSLMPTSVAATAPAACDSATHCGIAVIGTEMKSGRPITTPMNPPTTSPATIQSKRTISAWSSVPTMASSMPNAACAMPARAFSGPLRPRNPRMKKTELVR